MQIVISISNSFYDRLKDMDIDNDTCSFNESALVDIIQNGTPLPEGHGRLIDADAFLSKVNADRKHSAYARSWTADDVLNVLNNSYAPTIIEADRLEREE